LPADIAMAKAIKSARSPLRVVVQGDLATSTSTSVTTGTFRDRAIDSAGAELMVARRTAQGWRISAIHWSARRRN
jgi:ketosteroid isomerase-like protein